MPSKSHIWCKSDRGHCRPQEGYLPQSLGPYRSFYSISHSYHQLLTNTHPLHNSLEPISAMLTNFCFCCSECSLAPSSLITPVRRKEAVFISYPMTYSHALVQKPQTFNHKLCISVHLFLVWGSCSLSLPSLTLFEAICFRV